MAKKKMKKEKKETKKKGFFATIWESLTKSGGCCGSGKTCEAPSKGKNKK